MVEHTEIAFLSLSCLRWSPAFRQQADSGRSRFRIQVSKDFPDHRRVFNTSDHFDRTATLATGFNVNVKYPFESLRPGH